MRYSTLSSFFVLLSLVLIFGIASSAFALPKKEKFINAGQNEYVDPSKKDIYTKTYTEVVFEEGTTLEDIKQIQKVVPVFNNIAKTKAQFRIDTGKVASNGRTQLESLPAKRGMNDFQSAYQQKVGNASQSAKDGNVKGYSFFSDNHTTNVSKLKVLSGVEHNVASKKAKKWKNQLQNKSEQGDAPDKQTIRNTIKSVHTFDNKKLMDALHPRR